MADLTRVRVPLTMLHAEQGLGPGWWTFELRDGFDDMDVIEEIVVQDVYRLRGIDTTDWPFRAGMDIIGRPHPGATVIDLGAHVGIFAATCLQMGAAKVIAVEPHPENFELLRMNTAMRADRVELVNAAVSDDGRPRLIEGHGAQARSVRDDHGYSSVTLARILESLERVALCKVDIEGSEADVICACPSELLARVDRIVMETHGPEMCPWVERSRVGEMVEHLLPTHAVDTFGYPQRGGMLLAHRYPE